MDRVAKRSGSGMPTADAVAKVADFINAGALSQAMSVAAELRIPDLLASAPKKADELAQATDCNPSALQRLLRALASAALLEERTDGSFVLTELGAVLRSDADPSLRNSLLWWGKYLWPEWAQLRRCLKTGESARQRLHGRQGLGLLDDDPDAAAIFNAAMLEQTRLVAHAIVSNYDFAGCRCLMDIGGGYGELLAAILQALPNLRGVLFDRPHAMEGARSRLHAAAVLDRCDFASGDFFDSVPTGADVHILKSIVHDWPDERSIAILRSCRRALEPDGRLLLIERIMPDCIEPSMQHRAITRLDLTMMLGPGGRERTISEFEALLRASGFIMRQASPVALGFCVIEAAAQ
jgi:SAM-dependent methyltransferase